MSKEIYIPPYHQKSDSKFLMNFDYYKHRYKVRMEYQKTTHLLGKTNDQTSKFREELG